MKRSIFGCAAIARRRNRSEPASRQSYLAVFALVFAFLISTAALADSASVQGNWYDQDKYHLPGEPNGGDSWHHNWCADDIMANHTHDPGETWDEVEHEDWDYLSDGSCWMASAENMLSHWQQAQADMYDQWGYSNGLTRNATVYTFDNGGLQHYGLQDVGEEYQVKQKGAGPWQDPIDYVVASIKENSTVGMGIYEGSMAHAITCYAIDTDAQTITVADSDQDPGGNDFRTYHYSNQAGEWRLTDYQNQPEVKYLCAFDVVGWWVAGSGNWNQPMNWVGPTDMANWPVGCVPDSTKPVYFTQSNLGDVNINAAAEAKWILMDSDRAFASVNLFGGAELVVVEDITIGEEEIGRFQQSGGTNTVGGSLRLAAGAGSGGEYGLTGGQLSVVDEISAGASGGLARFEWFGGQIDTPVMTLGINSTLAMGFNFFVDALSSGDLFDSGGTLTGLDSATLEVTNWATATHFGGVTVGVLRVGGEGGAGFYDLEGGLGTGFACIDNGGAFNLTGTHISTTISVGESGTGTYDVHSGTLDVDNLQIGSQGGFSINDNTASIDIGQSLTFYEGAEYNAVAGTNIHMTGSTFDNQSTSETDLCGLENTTFIFEGGEGVFDTFEIACLDMGPVIEGLTDNFALYGLILGGEDIGYVQLVDYLDNGNRGGFGGYDEALYVKTLIINSGSTLDLNGYHLYTLEYNDLGGEVLNGEVVVLPEPFTAALAALGLIAVLLRRRSVPPPAGDFPSEKARLFRLSCVYICGAS